MSRLFHSRPSASCLLWGCLVSACAGLASGQDPVTQSSPPAASVSFRGDIAHVLYDRCLACHGPKKAEGNYRIDSYSRLSKAGDSELPPVVAGDLQESELLRRVQSEDAAERMPLDAEPLTDEQIELLKRWIAAGGQFDGPDPEADLLKVMPPRTHPPAPNAYAQPVPIMALTFSPQGDLLYVGGYREVLVWSVGAGKLVKRIGNVAQRTYALTFDPTGTTLAVASGDPGRLGEVRLFDAQSGTLQGVIAPIHDVTLDLAYDPSGRWLATAGADGLIRLIDVQNLETERVISSHSDWVQAVAWSDDGKLLASASRDKTAKVFDRETGSLKVTYSGHNQAVYGVAFRPDGSEVYTSGADKKLHRWKISDGKKTAETGFGGEVFRLTTAGAWLLAPSADQTLRQFDRAEHKEIRRLAGHQDWVLSVAAHPASQRIASGDFRGEVILWNAEEGKQIRRFLAWPEALAGEARESAAQPDER